MRRLVLATVMLFTSTALADQSPDICKYKRRSWSDMREVLVGVAAFKGRNAANVQKIARNALAGKEGYYVSEFTFHFTRGKSGGPTPNDQVCYSERVVFEAGTSGGGGEDDALWRCVANMDVGESITAIKCDLIAG